MVHTSCMFAKNVKCSIWSKKWFWYIMHTNGAHTVCIHVFECIDFMCDKGKESWASNQRYSDKEMNVRMNLVRKSETENQICVKWKWKLISPNERNIWSK